MKVKNEVFIKTLGTRIKTVRQTLVYKKKDTWMDGRTAPQELIAAKAGISKNQLYLIESGNNSRLQTLIDLSNALDFPLYGLLISGSSIDIYNKTNIDDTKQLFKIMESVFKTPDSVKQNLPKLKRLFKSKAL